MADAGEASESSSRRVLLHLGCGPVHPDGWINVDRDLALGPDVLADLSRELPFRRADMIFAEHFLEHLTLPAGLQLLRGCRRILAEEGVLRLSTPNLDHVWATGYPSRWVYTHAVQDSGLILPVEWDHGEKAARDALSLNRSFYGWGHRFLYNRGMLEAALRRAGFARVELVEYGESRHAELRGLEQHEKYDDLGGISHILVVEASGRADPDEAPWPEDLYRELLRDVEIA